MYAQVETPRESKSRAIANSVVQNKSKVKQCFGFVDNRPEAAAQRKLQEVANKKPQAKQAAQLQTMANNLESQQQQPIQTKENKTGLPDNLKSGIENLSGYSMDDVKVHYNSDKPAQLQAHAYAQGTDILLASGQVKHLPHEAWHVVQQKQGRVKPTMQMKGNVNINDDIGLEKEATSMGARAIQTKSVVDKPFQPLQSSDSQAGTVYQRDIDLTPLADTENDLYYTGHGGGRKLISQADAPPPQPRSLYNEQDNTALNGGELKVWKPRSKLADKKKLSGETPVYTETQELVTDLHEIQETVLAQMMREIQVEVNDVGEGEEHRLGTAGINDCLGYATTLCAMIARYGDNPQGLVGRMWVHRTDTNVATFPYHSATVVAQDGTDAVTLEAHAGQDITAPVFHIRKGGKTGFEDANKESAPGQYSDTADELQIETLQNATALTNNLKIGWADVNSRSDKSSIYETGETIVPTPVHVPEPEPEVEPQPSNRGKWILIGSILAAIIAGLVALSKSNSE
ncbi:MAG: DUF4157 domain-containing protein [Deltaproteobacteria bacterium]|nr:DUF4157 domain-containing protein [Deltaproteobacteria bacterium]